MSVKRLRALIVEASAGWQVAGDEASLHHRHGRDSITFDGTSLYVSCQDGPSSASTEIPIDVLRQVLAEAGFRLERGLAPGPNDG